MWLCIFGFICLGIGYALALQATMPTIALYFFCRCLYLSFRNVFSFTHGTAQILEMIKRNKKIMYTYPYLFIVNQLSHRMKENGRFSFNVNGNDVCSYGNRYGVLIFFWYARYVAWRGVHSFSYIEKVLLLMKSLRKERLNNYCTNMGMMIFNI